MHLPGCAMSSAVKTIIVNLSCWGFLPPRLAYWLLRTLRLSDA